MTLHCESSRWPLFLVLACGFHLWLEVVAEVCGLDSQAKVVLLICEFILWPQFVSLACGFSVSSGLWLHVCTPICGFSLWLRFAAFLPNEDTVCQLYVMAPS